jgi:asparagine synthase (glutamine-hydrolysing)
MRGIYGICEPGVQLPASAIEPISLAMAVQDGQRRPSPTGTGGALLSSAGPHPFSSHGSCNRTYVAIDADLSNYGQLLAAQREGADNTTATLPNIVAALYERYGIECFERIEGQFAVAIWDSDSQQLLLATDRHSFKTLYWSIDNGRLIFSSRLRAIECVKRTEVNPAAVLQFLIHTVVPAPLTIYKNVERLEPGTILVYHKGQVRKHQYWNLNYAEAGNSTIGEWQDNVRECLRQSVHTALEDCEPERVGAYLSGGTDSSTVLAFASERRSPFDTFSIYFENRRYDEIGFARSAAEHFHAQYHEECLQVDDAASAIPRIIGYYEEPFANSSAIGAYRCARLAREHGMDVLLAGDGGDELFAGNERYATDKKFALYHSLPEGIRESVIKPAARRLPASGALSLPMRYIRRAEMPNPRRMFSYNFFLTPEGLEALTPDFVSETKPHDAMHIAQAHFDSAPQATSELNRLLYLDVKMTLSDNDLRKVIGTAELAGVRVRFPLLDRRLVELAGRIPSRLKLKGFEKRYIFKQAMKNILPDRILYKKKHGFGVPVGYWMANDPKMKSWASVLNEPETRQRGYFRPEFLSSLQELNPVHPAYYGEILWTVLMLELWHRRSRECPANRVETLQAGAVHAG